MTLTQRIEAKRAEYAQIGEQEAKLWSRYQAEEERIKRDFRDPWYDARIRHEKLEKEIEALESLAKEMEAA